MNERKIQTSIPSGCSKQISISSDNFVISIEYSFLRTMSIIDAPIDGPIDDNPFDKSEIYEICIVFPSCESDWGIIIVPISLLLSSTMFVMNGALFCERSMICSLPSSNIGIVFVDEILGNIDIDIDEIDEIDGIWAIGFNDGPTISKTLEILGVIEIDGVFELDWEFGVVDFVGSNEFVWLDDKLMLNKIDNSSDFVGVGDILNDELVVGEDGINVGEIEILDDKDGDNGIVGDGVSVIDDVLVGDGDGETDGEILDDELDDNDFDFVTDGEGLGLGVGDNDSETVIDDVSEIVGVFDADAPSVIDPVGVCVVDELNDFETLGDADDDSLCETVDERDVDTDGDNDPVIDAVSDADDVFDAVGVADDVGVFVGVFVGLFVGVSVGVFVGVLVGVLDGVFVKVEVGVFVEVLVPVPVVVGDNDFETEILDVGVTVADIDGSGTKLNSIFAEFDNDPILSIISYPISTITDELSISILKQTDSESILASPVTLLIVNVSKLSISESLSNTVTQQMHVDPALQFWLQVSSFATGFELICNENAEFPNPESIRYDATTGSELPGIEYCLYSVIALDSLSLKIRPSKSVSSELTIKTTSPELSVFETLASIVICPLPAKFDEIYNWPYVDPSSINDVIVTGELRFNISVVINSSGNIVASSTIVIISWFPDPARIEPENNWVIEAGEELNTFPLISCIPTYKDNFGVSIVNDDCNSEFPWIVIVFKPITLQLNIIVPLLDSKSNVVFVVVISFVEVYSWLKMVFIFVESIVIVSEVLILNDCKGLTSPTFSQVIFKISNH